MVAMSRSLAMIVGSPPDTRTEGQMRRRKKKSGNGQPPKPDEDTRTIEELPILDTYCSECLKGGLRERQRQAPGGSTCKFGHGGVLGITVSELERAGFPSPDKTGEELRQAEEAKLGSREIQTRTDAAGFEVRDGDRLTVMYHGAKLQIAPYNSVELDGGIYSRTLKEGDDPVAEWDRIYAYLERKALEHARKKLRTMSTELHRARKNVETGTAYDG